MSKELIDKLEKLKHKKAALDNKIKIIEARNKTKNRKLDTRRKILIGSYYLDKSMKDNSFDNLCKLMDLFLIRDSDRILFNLKPLNTKNEKNNPS